MADASNSALEKRIKKHVIGKPHRFMAVAPLGFEDTLAEELKYIGVECAAGIQVAGDGKVEFTAKITEAWKAVAYSRIANRVLMEIGNFKAENFGQLEKGVAAVPWELFLGERSAAKSRNLGIHVTCKHSRLYHSDAVKERIQKVVLNSFQNQQINTEYSQNLYVTLIDDRCTLWLDLAGEELYKRGHERFVAEAPLKETIAAAMIFEASKIAGTPIPQSTEGATPHLKASEASAPLPTSNFPLPTSYFLLPTIIDPMAGSGTFSLEAAYIANGLIPGKCRDFALKHQPAFKEGTWNFILKGRHSETAAPFRHSEQRSDEESTTNLLTIITSDISERPVDIIKHNVDVSPLAEIAQSNPDAVTINPQLKDFFTYTIDDICAVQPPANQSSIILLNPPYGKRLAIDAPKLYTKIGKKLNELAGVTVAILVPKDCMEPLLKYCPTLNHQKNESVKLIETSHGGFSLNAIFAKI
ncbi:MULTISPECIES: class I SAM-dependent RNA methyltransferase [unclassified Fibrobacter]|uniref:THUMP domain-containing class I SAM-dependent RNA methyltransferase n=1 Tax=unclassified Fibrobacter TaxID=2634177 RepID=UPI000D7AA06A|nr:MULTISPECIES: RNA methyltransferase [unclassified Fibrobacter]PWJ60798.1 putative N6-adenine-specific DNA methylase [Fibrobacter sp. UWR4]PZW64659.1 putative N6-adenine-specific DNA methylase [Fibrobacter sp. UWR1]